MKNMNCCKRSLIFTETHLLPQQKVLDLTVVDPELRGFTGGFVAGHWGFLVPFKSKDGEGEFSGKMVRFDLRTFDYAGITVRWRNLV